MPASHLCNSRDSLTLVMSCVSGDNTLASVATGIVVSKEEALKICADHMNGGWSDLLVCDFGFTVLKGGFINRIFVCENKNSGEKLLLRLYGGKVMGADTRLRGGGYEHEVLVFNAMAENGIGPKLIGVFPGGRLEQFVDNAVIMTPSDTRNEGLMAVFARKLAKIHSIHLPFTRKARDYFAMIEGVMNEDWDFYVQLIGKKEIPDFPEAKEGASLVLNTDVKSLVEWYKETEPKINGKVNLCHGDLNPANCLIRSDVQDHDERLVLLDFEFMCYAYRGKDIGNHFVCRGIDFKQVHAGRLIEQEYPHEDQRRGFVQEYLKELKRIPGYIFDEEMDNEYQILLEAEFYGSLIYFHVMTEAIIRKWEDNDHSAMPTNTVMWVGHGIRMLRDGKTRTMDLLARGGL